MNAEHGASRMDGFQSEISRESNRVRGGFQPLISDSRRR